MQIPCGRRCNPTPTSSLTNDPTETPTTCGYVPSSCQVDLQWAANTGTKSNGDRYPEFEAITGVTLSAATTDDVQLYWSCRNMNVNGNCEGLEMPCGRTCGSSTLVDQAEPLVESNGDDAKNSWLWIVVAVSVVIVIAICISTIF